MNRISISQATPGETTYLMGSLQVGSTPIPGCGGSQNALELMNPVLLGLGDSGPDGQVSFSIHVPPGFAGVEIQLQAVEPATCRTSARKTFTP